MKNKTSQIRLLRCTSKEEWDFAKKIRLKQVLLTIIYKLLLC